jgi:hypothetical protein
VAKTTILPGLDRVLIAIQLIILLIFMEMRLQSGAEPERPGGRGEEKGRLGV